MSIVISLIASHFLGESVLLLWNNGLICICIPDVLLCCVSTHVLLLAHREFVFHLWQVVWSHLGVDLVLFSLILQQQPLHEYPGLSFNLCVFFLLTQHSVIIHFWDRPWKSRSNIVEEFTVAPAFLAHFRLYCICVNLQVYVWSSGLGISLCLILSHYRSFSHCTYRICIHGAICRSCSNWQPLVWWAW